MLVLKAACSVLPAALVYCVWFRAMLSKTWNDTRKAAHLLNILYHDVSDLCDPASHSVDCISIGIICKVAHALLQHATEFCVVLICYCILCCFWAIGTQKLVSDIVKESKWNSLTKSLQCIPVHLSLGKQAHTPRVGIRLASFDERMLSYECGPVTSSAIHTKASPLRTRTWNTWRSCV